MGGQGSGRKPMVDSGKRVRLCVEVHPKTYAGLYRLASNQKTSVGRAIDALWTKQIDK